jgi:hypothetical protein
MIGISMTVKTEHQLQDGGTPKYVYHDKTAWRCAVFWENVWQQKYS